MMSGRVNTVSLSAVRDILVAGGFFFLFGVGAVRANSPAPSVSTADSTVQTRRPQRDTTATVADTLAREPRVAVVLDTIIALPAHGRLLLTRELPGTTISKMDMQLVEYDGLFELLEEFTHVYPLSLGSPGQFNHLSFYGAMPQSVGFTYNGRPLADPVSGTFNPEHFPVEAAERVEVLTGTYAIALEDNTAGALVNLQEIRYDTRRPFTRIWYHQGGYGHTASDGVFSQNVAEGLNITAGFRRQSSTGRYENSRIDTWNIRGAIRWNLSDYTNISLSEIFTSHYNETNGGVDAELTPSIGNERTAEVLYPEADERVYRHDVTLTLTSYLSEDSTTAFSGVAYYSHALWEKDRVEALRTGTSDTSNLVPFVNRRLGVTGKLEQRFQALQLTAGGKLEQMTNERTVYFPNNTDIGASAFGLVTLFPHEVVQITGGLRARFADEAVYISAGARADIQLNERLSLSGDLSRSVRTVSVLEGSNLLNEEHLLALGGLHWKEGRHSADVTAFYRSVRNPVQAFPVVNSAGTIVGATYGNGEPINTFGAIVSYTGRVGSFVGTAFANLSRSNSAGRNIEQFPLMYGGLTVMYEYMVGRSALRGGVRLRGLTSFRGQQYNPLTWSYFSVAQESDVRGNGLDLVASATLGNAFIRASFNNLFGETYYFVPFYPEEANVFRLSVSWAFLD
jgi:hypothetical protein